MEDGSEIQGFISENLLLNEFSSAPYMEPAPCNEPDPFAELDLGAQGTLSSASDLAPSLEPTLVSDSAPPREDAQITEDTLSQNITVKRKLDNETEENVKKPRTDQDSTSSDTPGVNGVSVPPCEVTSSSPEKQEPERKEIPSQISESLGDPKPTNPASGTESETPEEEEEGLDTEEPKDEEEGLDTEEPKDEEEMDQTANKLKASGISISLIKKKKEENNSTEENSVEEKESEPEKEEQIINPLEVGPNISVTMINKGTAENQNKFTISLKSQSELLDPKKNETKAHSANMLANGVGDAISVSRISKSLSVSSPGIQSISTFTNSKSMMGSPPGVGLHRPLISQPGHGLPGLQHRPNGRSNLPLATGTVSEQLNVVASGIAEYMRHGIEEVLRELSAQGSHEATIKGLQLELEKMQWRHQQELTEVKQGIDIMLKDMKTNMAKDSQRTIEEFKKQAEMERQKAILETKKKQWCSHCGKEAIFYCCWNTSYCDYPCQQAHWPSHMATCSQSNQEEESQAHDTIPEQKPIHAVSSSALLNSLTRQTNSMPMNTMNLSNSAVGMGPGMGFVMPGMGMGMRPGMGMRSAMGVSIRPGMPGQLTISRPYFM